MAASTMEPEKNFQATVPPLLLKQVQDAAEAERVTVDEFVRDAMERRLRERRRQNLYSYGEAQAAQLLQRGDRRGSPSDDEVMEYVDSIIHEMRDEERDRERQNRECGH